MAFDSARHLMELALSLGYRATRIQGTARLNGRDCGPSGPSPSSRRIPCCPGDGNSTVFLPAPTTTSLNFQAASILEQVLSNLADAGFLPDGPPPSPARFAATGRPGCPDSG